MNIKDLASAAAAMKQQPMAPLAPLDFGKIKLGTKDNSLIDYFPGLEALETHISELVKLSAVSIAIKRLAENPSIAQWVEVGINIHKDNGDGVCEYCQQKIPPERLNALASHFNDSDNELKLKIGQAIQDLENMQAHLQAFSLPANSNLYPELHQVFSGAGNEISVIKRLLLDHLGRVVN